MTSHGVGHLELTSGSGEVGHGELSVIEMRGCHEVSRPYEYELKLSTMREGGLGAEAIEDLLRTRTHVRYGEGIHEVVHGVIREFETLTPGEASGPYHYRALLVPRLWHLGLTKQTRIFQELNVLDILRQVLSEHGMNEGAAVDLDGIQESYPTQTFVMQYEESDLDFLHRMMEHWGLFYFFTMEGDAERMVICDHLGASEAIPEHESVHFSNASGGVDHGTMITFDRIHRVVTSEVVVRGFNSDTPNVRLFSRHSADPVTGVGFLDSYGDHHVDDGQGAFLARVRAEELATGRETYRGRGHVRGLLAGYRFALGGHHLQEMDKGYFVTKAEHRAVSTHGGAIAEYEAEYEAVPLDGVFRAARRTRVPKVEGLLIAKIDGAVLSTAAPIDEQGRYHVVFPHDLYGQAGGRSSCPIRMAQPSTGAGYGFHTPLHVGMEVVIAFIDGNPDLPIIVGAVPNPETPSPVTAGNPTHSQLKSRSSILMELNDDA